MITTGTFETEHASKYLQQLCKHFAHKVDVEYSETEGHAALPVGPAVMQARGNLLTVEITLTEPEGLERAQMIIDSHLQKFAFREAFETMAWSTTDA